MMKYFRYYPWGMQLVLFLLMTFTFLSGASVIVYSLFPRLSGMPLTVLTDIGPSSTRQAVRAFLTVQGVQSSFIFLLPAAVFAYLTHPRPGGYLGLRRPGRSTHWILAITLMAGAMPLLSGLQELMSHIDFGAEVKKSQEAQEGIMKALMTMPSFGDFIATFLVVAIVPGIGEELFFRGVFMRFSAQRSRNMVIPILLSAVVFSYAHFNVYGGLSIFIAGVLLALIYYFTGSLLVSMAAHIFFNGIQVVLNYAGNSNPAMKQAIETDSMPVAAILAGAVVFGISLWLLIKTKTPLPAGWTADFSPAEIEEMKRERDSE